jgi:hypothetical protein
MEYGIGGKDRSFAQSAAAYAITAIRLDNSRPTMHTANSKNTHTHLH